MNVINVPPKIFFVSNHVLPKAPLPNAALAFLQATFR